MSSQWDNQPSNEPSGQQPQYGQGPNGPRDPQGQQWQQQPYPNQQPYPPQQQYNPDPRQAPQQWAQNQQAYGAPQGYGVPRGKRSPVLGIVGLLIVVLATVGLSILSWTIGRGLGVFLLDVAAAGPNSFNEADLASDPRVIAYAETAAGAFGAAGLACVVGLVGWIISIVATATNRGRVFGIIGIVLGVLSLPIAYVVLTTALTPAITQLGG